MGTVQGGVFCDIADAAMGMALASTLEPDQSFTTLELKISDVALLPEALQQVRNVLMSTHRGIEDFTFRTQEDWAEQIKTFVRNARLSGGLIAGISLLVGGIGIMNIMLVSVTERTREIGLRMAVGARSHHILRQFLVEAVVLCLFGGAMGILLGRGSSLLVRQFLHWPTETSLIAMVASVVVSAAVGVLFGFYPAWKASRLDPIEALRYE